MTTFPPTFVALIVEVFLPLMTTSQRKKGEKEKGKGRDKKKDKRKQNKKKKRKWGCCWWKGLSIACLLQTFLLFLLQTHFPPHFGNIGLTRVQIQKECYEQKLKQKKYLTISCLSKNSSAKHKLQY